MNAASPKRSWKRLALAILGLIVVASWAALVAGMLLDVPKAWKLGLLAVAAIATEIAFWTAAALLGVTVFQARRQTWNRIVGRFRPPQ